MLFCKTATVSHYSRNANTWISSYWSPTSITCNVQPVGVKDGFSGDQMYNSYKFYTRYLSIVPGDKITYNSEVYIVDSVLVRDWLQEKFLKCFISKSNGN